MQSKPTVRALLDARDRVPSGRNGTGPRGRECPSARAVGHIPPSDADFRSKDWPGATRCCHGTASKRSATKNSEKTGKQIQSKAQSARRDRQRTTASRALFVQAWATEAEPAALPHSDETYPAVSPNPCNPMMPQSYGNGAWFARGTRTRFVRHPGRCPALSRFATLHLCRARLSFQCA